MKNQSNGMFPFGGFFPGQREGSKRDIKTELILVRKQTGDNIVLWTGIFLCLFAVVLIIGPILGYVIGIALCLAILAYGYAFVYEQRAPVPQLVAIVGLALLGFWILAGYPITDRFWWTVRCEWEPRNKLALVLFLLGLAVILFLNMYRFAYEVVDPNSRPTIQPRPPDWGILWPWSRIPRDDVEPEVVEVEKIVTVPRPYQVPSNGKGNGTQNVIQDLDEKRVDMDGKLQAPSGEYVAVADLVEFVKLGAVYGVTFSTWKKRYTRIDRKKKWSHPYWKDVTDMWEIYGVVDQRGERNATRLVVTDLKEALRRLSSAFDDSPTLT